MFHEKRKLTNINFRDQDCNRAPVKCSIKDFIYPKSIMLQIFIEDSGNLKNVTNINNTTTSHLVSCRVILRPATVKGLEKEML